FRRRARHAAPSTATPRRGRILLTILPRRALLGGARCPPQLNNDRGVAMQIAVMGTGGVGGYFGARLALGGSDVSFIARGKHLEAMRQRGLKIESALGEMHVRAPRVTDSPAAIGAVDLVLFGVKLWDTEAAAKAIVPLLRPGTAVVSLQNGV